MRTTVAALTLAALWLPYPTGDVLAGKAAEHNIYMNAIGNVKASEQGKAEPEKAEQGKPKVPSVEPSSAQKTPQQ
jgi:hypothetical protein